MRGKIQALTAEGRFQAIILLALPPGVFVMMLGLNSEYGTILLQHPPLIWITIISEAIGALSGSVRSSTSTTKRELAGDARERDGHNGRIPDGQQHGLPGVLGHGGAQTLASRPG